MGNMLRALCVLALLAPSLARSQAAPGWEQAKRDVLADYRKQQPGDQVKEITGPERKEGALIVVRYYGSAVVERADKSRTNDRFWVEYRLFGTRWELQTVKVYEQNVQSDIAAPSKAQAQELIAAAWKAGNCEGFDIRSIALEGEPRFQIEATRAEDRPKAKRSYIYQVQIDAVGTGKFRLSKEGAAYVNRLQHLLHWDPQARAWSVDPRHVRCGGFSEKR
ncbi:MAG: hypothetical protein AB1452_03340 [Pseudomonadota bacterium]